jgi:tetratricopeptide (TPR) repeat protein
MEHTLNHRAASVAAVLLGALIVAGCSSTQTRPARWAATAGRVEATSLLGEPLYAPDLSREFRDEQEKLLEQARADLEARPGDADAMIWEGRRNAYLGRYQAAIEIYTEGLALHPNDARFLRHRGHRYITTRRLEDAVRDLERASEMTRGRSDEVERDGLPNEFNIPTSTLQSNIGYHLGLARYLQGDFEGALDAYRACMEVSKNPDMLSATSHWLYMTLRRLGRDDEARTVLEPIHADMKILENHAYHRLLLMYRGEADAETLLAAAEEGENGVGFASTAYGVGNWYFSNGDGDRAREIFARIVETDSWAAFGYIAAEAELARGR